MSRNTLVLTLLLGGSLVWAYLLTYPVGGAASRAGVTVWQVEPRDVARLIYHEKRRKTVLEPRWQEGQDRPYIWIRQETPPPASSPHESEKAAADKDAKKTSVKNDKAAAEVVKKPPQITVLKGNESAKRLLDNFSRLIARRSLGDLAGWKAEDFGLPAPAHSLELQLHGGREPLLLELGRASYGRRMRYALLKDMLYLFQENAFSRLRQPKKLLDLQLLSHPLLQAERIELRGGEKRKVIWQLKEVQGSNRWSENPEDEEGNPELLGFLRMLDRLKVRAYLREEDAAAENGAENGAADAPLQLEITFHPLEKNTSTPTTCLKLFRGKEGQVLARSSHTIAPVRLNPREGQNVLKKGNELLDLF